MYDPKPVSIIIVSYNRPDDLLDLLKSITRLEDTGELLEAVYVLNSGSTDDYSAVTAFIAAHPEINFLYEYSEENLGATKGRNKLIRQSRSPILVQLDDDAYFRDADALKHIIDAFDTNDKQPIGIVAFKVIYESTNTLQETAFPHKKIDKYIHRPRFLTSYFIGCGLAIKKEACEAAGLYPEDFFYYMEEYDLAYRVIDSGYAIAYDDSVVIMHKESPLGRIPNKEKMLASWYNKSVVAYRYLPLLYFVTTAVMWSFEYLRKTSWHWQGWWRGWKKICGIPRRIRLQKINRTALRYLDQVEARLWY